MAFAEDLTAFLDTVTGFAVNATIGGSQVAVIYEAAYADAFGLVAGTAPVLLASSADVSSVALGDAVTVEAVGYTVTGIEPDGTGLTRLRLNLA